MTQVLTFAGSLYFKDHIEEKYFCHFIGYCPDPRTEAQNNFFVEGLIRKNGFVELKYRDLIFCDDKENLSKFVEDPSKLIRSLLEIRNFNLIPKTAHHFEIFIGKTSIKSGKV
jgi:hypothetical protein